VRLAVLVKLLPDLRVRNVGVSGGERRRLISVALRRPKFYVPTAGLHRAEGLIGVAPPFRYAGRSIPDFLRGVAHVSLINHPASSWRGAAHFGLLRRDTTGMSFDRTDLRVLERACSRVDRRFAMRSTISQRFLRHR